MQTTRPRHLSARRPDSAGDRPSHPSCARPHTQAETYRHRAARAVLDTRHPPGGSGEELNARRAFGAKFLRASVPARAARSRPRAKAQGRIDRGLVLGSRQHDVHGLRLLEAKRVAELPANEGAFARELRISDLDPALWQVVSIGQVSSAFRTVPAGARQQRGVCTGLGGVGT